MVAKQTSASKKLIKTVELLQEKVATQELLLKQLDNTELPVTGQSYASKEQPALEDPMGLIRNKILVKDLFLLYLKNQFIFRGMNIRADEVVSSGFTIVGEDQVGVDKCSLLIKKSGGKAFIKQWSLNADVGGDGYVEKLKNQAGNEIGLLKLVSPINFGFLVDLTTSEIILNEEGTPKAYMQYVQSSTGQAEYIEVEKEKISHLMFNTIGDEFTGISTIQPLYNTAIRLMNMEHASAQAAVKTANPTWVVGTTTKSATDLAKWAKILGNISSQEVVFTPDGVKIDLKSPGNQNFNDYADYFLNAVIAALGVPKSILLGLSDSGSGNRSTVTTQSKHFYDVISAMQEAIADRINEIFEEYASIAGFKAPIFKFNSILEDEDRDAQRATTLYAAGLITVEEGRKMIGKDTTPEQKLELDNKANAKLKIAPTDNVAPKIVTNNEQKQEDMRTWHKDQIHPQAGEKKLNLQN